MEIKYIENVANKIDEEIKAAKNEGRAIRKILLSHDEYEELTGGNIHHTPQNYKGILIEKSGLVAGLAPIGGLQRLS